MSRASIAAIARAPSGGAGGCRERSAAPSPPDTRPAAGKAGRPGRLRGGTTPARPRGEGATPARGRLCIGAGISAVETGASSGRRSGSSGRIESALPTGPLPSRTATTSSGCGSGTHDEYQRMVRQDTRRHRPEVPRPPLPNRGGGPSAWTCIRADRHSTRLRAGAPNGRPAPGSVECRLESRSGRLRRGRGGGKCADKLGLTLDRTAPYVAGRRRARRQAKAKEHTIARRSANQWKQRVKCG